MMERNQKRSHLTVIDGNVYQIKTKQNQLKQKFNLGNGVVSILMEPTRKNKKQNVLKKDNV
jgi:hypothetical protein